MMFNRMMFKRITFMLVLIEFSVAVTRPICQYGEFPMKGESGRIECHKCPVCDVGTGVNRRCLGSSPYDPQDRPRCVPCIAGKTFSDTKGTETCDECAPIPKNHIETRKCTRFHDRRTECKRGYFIHGGHHRCDQQCCYCKPGQEYVAKCVKDGMEDKRYCAPPGWDRICHPKRPLVTLIPTPPPVATVATTASKRKTTQVKTPTDYTSSPNVTTTPEVATLNTTAATTAATSTNPTLPPTAETAMTSSSTNPTLPPTTETAIRSSTSRPTVPPPITAVPTKPKPEKPSKPDTNSTTVIIEKTVVVKEGSLPVLLACLFSAALLVVLIGGVIYWCKYRRGSRNVTAEERPIRGRPPPVPLEHVIRERISSIVSRPPSLYERVINPNSAQSSERSSTRSSQTLIAYGESSAHGSQDPLLLLSPHQATKTPSQIVRDVAPRPRPDHEYSECGLWLKNLRYIQREALAGLCDPRGRNHQKNWLEIGYIIAAGDAILRMLVDRCHQCYYGGGYASEEMFATLSLTKPEYTVLEFVKIATNLGMTDVVELVLELIPEHITAGKFVDITEENRKRICDLLERRPADDVVAHWPSFADKLGFTMNEIEYFRLKKIVPAKYSPTQELIMVLNAHRPQFTVEEFQQAAARAGRLDVCDYLDRVIQDKTNGTHDSMICDTNG